MQKIFNFKRGIGIKSEKSRETSLWLKIVDNKGVKEYRNKLVLWYDVSSVGVKKDC